MSENFESPAWPPDVNDNETTNALTFARAHWDSTRMQPARAVWKFFSTLFEASASESQCARDLELDWND